MATTSSFFDKTIDYKRSTACWIACPISTINTAIASNTPSGAVITGLKLNVEADFGHVLANAYIQYGWGTETSINKHLLNSSGADTKLTSTDPVWYPSGGVNIFGYLNSDNRTLSTANGNYLAFRFYSTNIFLEEYRVTKITLDITYHTHNYSPSVTKTATCTDTGVRTYTCSCGKSSYTETIPIDPNNHTGSQTTISAKAATCTSTGLTEGKKWSCCNAIITAQQTVAENPNNHTGNQTTIPAVNPTRTTSGLTEGKKWSCCNAIITAQQTTHLVTVVCGEGGTVTGLNVGDSVVIDGDKITLTATPNEGYRFYGFRVSNKDGNDIIERYELNTIIMTINKYLSFEAIFEKLAPEITSVEITRSSDLAKVTINTPVDAGTKYIISVEVI